MTTACTQRNFLKVLHCYNIKSLRWNKSDWKLVTVYFCGNVYDESLAGIRYWWELSKLFYHQFAYFHFLQLLISSPFPYAYVVVYFANKNGCQTHKATWQVLMMPLLTLSVYKVIFQFEISIGDQERMNLMHKILISEYHLRNMNLSMWFACKQILECLLSWKIFCYKGTNCCGSRQLLCIFVSSSTWYLLILLIMANMQHSCQNCIRLVN